jgi:23S rRNA maturation mini-RNase III
MKVRAIDILQFVPKKTVSDIVKAKDQKYIVQKVYYELQQKENTIRKRILVASSRSETVARINSKTI